MPDPKDIASRKADHLQLCLDEDVGFAWKTTGLDAVELEHDALPEMALDEVDLTTSFLGRSLRAPLVIAAMTGGTARAGEINRDLARAAERFGLAFGFGSQRPLLVRGIEDGYFVRDVAPTALILGNIGVVQARETTTARLRELLDRTGADALCVHLNPAMEVVQPEGDRDFRGGLDTIARLVQELGKPVVVKETGCGLSRRVGERLARVGVGAVDVSGAGGTSWVQVETLRAGGVALGERFRDWGIPTADSIRAMQGLGFEVVATGGIRHGLDVAKALALGATVAGMARPFLVAQAAGRLEEVVAGTIEELRVACLLTGSRTPDALGVKRQGPVQTGPNA